MAERSKTFGPNAVRSHHASACWSVLARQVNSPLLWLLLAAAAVSAFVGEGIDAVIIGVIVVASVGLGFANEYRAERAAEAMHSEIRHLVTVVRDGAPASVEVTHLVPGDVVRLDVGSIVPADVRLLAASNLECDESILTGESVPAAKSADPGARPARRSPICRRACSWARSCTRARPTPSSSPPAGSPSSAGSRSASASVTPRPSSSSGSPASPGCSPRSAASLSVTIFVVNVAARPTA